MIIMNRRTVQEMLPVTVIGLLNDWLLRGFVLVSLLSQIELVLLGNRRKYTPGKLLRCFIFLAYTTKDAVIDIFIGVLVKCQDNSSQQSDMIKVLVFGLNTYTKYIFLGCRSSNFIDEEC